MFQEFLFFFHISLPYREEMTGGKALPDREEKYTALAPFLLLLVLLILGF